DTAMRARVSEVIEKCDLDELRRWVHVLDPARAHLGRTQLLRAIEIALLTGHRMSDLHRTRARSSRWRPHYLVVDPGPALAEHVGSRIDHMLDHGWPQDVRLLMQTIPPDAPAWNATGYDAVRRLVVGALNPAAADERILLDTRQYAKRQRTWFRHQLPLGRVTRVDPRASDWKPAVDRWFDR